MKFIYSFFLIILFISCATTENHTKAIHLNKDIVLNIEGFKNIFPKQTLLVQLVEFKGMERIEKVQVVFKNEKSLKIIALDHMGLELFDAEFPEQGEPNYSSKLPLDRRLFSKIVSDILIVYSNREELITRFAQKVVVEDTKKTRVLSSGKKKFIEIRYSDGHDWNSNIDYVNYEHGYRLKITILKNELLHK